MDTVHRKQAQLN